MKKFNRVLAMLLALVTVLAVLPLSVLADDWLNVDVDKTTPEENVTATDITVTVDPKALLSYIQDGDIKGLLKGISASGSLGNLMTKEELLAIVPEEDIIALVKDIINDINVKELLACLDADKLLACVDKDGLINLLKAMDLKSYIKDGGIDIVMKYISDDDIKAAIEYVDTDALIDDYSDALMDLALDLAPEKLFEIVDVNKAVKLNGIKIEDAANKAYFETVIAKDAGLSAYIKDGAVEELLAGVGGYAALVEYMNLDNAAAILEAGIDENDLLDSKYWVDGIIGGELIVEVVFNDNLVEGLYDKLLNGDGTNAAALDLSVVLFGDATKDLPALFALSKLIADKVIDVDKLAAKYGYANLVNTSAIKNQIVNSETISSADIVACLKSYDAAIDAIGVEEVIEAVGGYMTLPKYVDSADYKALISIFNVMGIAKSIIVNREITDIVDVEGLIKAIDVRAFLSKVNVKQLVKVVYESGIAQELLRMLDVDSYIGQFFLIVAAFQYNITEIEIDGTVITTQNEEGYLKLLPDRFIDSLENLVPTLNELANLDDSGKLFEAGFSFSYRVPVDEDNEIIKKKVINFNFVLTHGTDMIRRAAAKLSALLDKVGTISLTGGKLVADVKIPSEFASVLRIALEALEDSTDPEMNALKDKILAAYTAQPDDFIAFAEGLTLEEVIAVLEAVDPALFGKVYNKALASRYAQVLLSYVERVTGYDLSDNLEAQNLVNTLATIPTFEVFVEKLENVTGIEITDRLPAKVNGYLDNTVYDVIEKLAAKFGYEFDMQNLLQQAAASDDPFAYLYTAVVDKAENASGIYNFVKRNALKVANRLMATRVGDVIADNCLMDFYRGNSAFEFEKSVTFDAKALVEKVVDKVLNKLANRAPGVASKLDYIVEYGLDMFLADDTQMTTGFDVTLRVTNLYRVTYTTANGAVILNTLLPVGTDLNKMLDYSKYEGALGWIDTATGDYITKMPAKDLVVKLDVEVIPDPEKYTVTLIVKDETGATVGTKTFVEIEAGTILSTLGLDAAAAELYKDLTVSAKDALLGFAYAHDWNNVDFTAAVNGDMEVVAVVSKVQNLDNAHIDVEGLAKFEADENAFTVTVNANWNSFANGLTFKFTKALLQYITDNHEDLVLTAVATADEVVQKVTISNAMVETLLNAATGDEVTFSYKFNGTNAVSGKQTFDFAFGGVNEIADFGEGVQFILPFAGLVKDELKQQTFVYAGTDVVTSVETTENTVTFFAPHFSEYTIVNKYYFEDDTNTYVDDVAVDGLGSIAAIQGANNASVSGWYEAGEKVTGTIVKLPLSGYNYIKTVVDGQEFGEGAFEFTMPAKAVTAQHHAEKILVYYVYYYVNGALDATLTKEYTAADAAANGFADTLQALPAGYNAADGWTWFGFDASKIAQDNMHLFLVNTKQSVVVEFYMSAMDQAPAISYTYTIAQLMDTNFDAIAALVSAIEQDLPGYTWKDADGKALADYVNADLITATDVKFIAEQSDRNYQISVEGDATVDKTEAKPGETVKVTPAVKEGYTATIKVVTVGGVEITVNSDNAFTMPSDDVIVTVTHTAITLTYKEVVITVPAGSTLAVDPTTLASAPADLVLYKVERGNDGSLKLTYRYTVTEGFDETAFLADVENLVTAGQYATTWFVNGVAYNSEAEAMNAELPEGAKIVGWSELSQNVMVAIIEYTAPESSVSVWIIVCIVLVVLLLIALIVLVYVLHVTDKIGASWLTKVCTAIVSAFFAVCMFLAKITLKVLNFVGIKTEDMLEELPGEEPVEDVPAVVHDLETEEEVAAEEATEEAAEEAVAEEAPAEEATEEAAEEAVVEEAPAEEATEEAAEEAVVEEAPAEEATEETAEEAVVEEAPVEEATEEAVEGAVVEEAPAEEATEEAVEEAVVEEAPAEEATEEEASEEEKKDE